MDWLLSRDFGPDLLWFFEVGGDTPKPWQLIYQTGSWDEASSRMSRYNTLNVYFVADPFEGKTGSERLLRAFRRMHTPYNTEFAAIHPFIRIRQLAVRHLAWPIPPYCHPLTYGNMFLGVFGVNYLSAEHLKFFDETKLTRPSTYCFEHIPQTSLFMQLSPDIAQARNPEVEAEMFRLTDAFRAAMR